MVDREDYNNDIDESLGSNNRFSHIISYLSSARYVTYMLLCAMQYADKISDQHMDSAASDMMDGNIETDMLDCIYARLRSNGVIKSVQELLMFKLMILSARIKNRKKKQTS